MRLTIYHEISHSGQFEGTEFIDDNSLLWFLTPVNDGTCHLLGHKFGRRTDNASILMKFCTQHKSRTVISMVTIGFCNFWRLSILTPVSIGTCHLLGHSFGRKTANVSILMKFCTLHKSKVGNSIMTIVFCDSRSLSNLAPVNIGTCHHLGHSFELIKFETLHKSKTLNSMVTKFFYNFWRLSILIPVNVSTCQIFGPKLWTKNGKCFNFVEVLYSKQIESGEFNGDDSFLWFLTTVKFDASQYWHLSYFRPQIWMKNGKCFNFDETLYPAQIEDAEFNGDNSFL